MVVHAAWALRQREQALAAEARQETRAYATALGLAFDYALRDVREERVQEIINRVSRAPTVYAVLVYDSTGARRFVSDPLRAPDPLPPAVLGEVLRTGRMSVLERELEGKQVFSVVRALRSAGPAPLGALEVAQPRDFIDEQLAATRWRFLINTLTLLLALSGVTLWLVRRVVSRPMERLVDGARAIGRGELSHRIPEDEGGEELAVVAREFNGMAHNLERARAAVGREAEERVALERRLHEAEKMAAIGSLAAGLAHEIAAPLNVVSARAELLVRRDPGPADRARSLQVIVQQIGRITTIVRNLLDFARRREPRLRPLDLAEIIDGGLELLEFELARAGVTVRREVSRPVSLQGDPDLLHQLLVNLLLNAAQALEAREGPRELVVRASGGSQVVLEVQDSGPGIPTDALERLFDPFFTTKSRGTGLGLVVARNIAQEHGGTLEARNREDGPGALFRCVLPGRPAEASHG